MLFYQEVKGKNWTKRSLRRLEEGSPSNLFALYFLSPPFFLAFLCSVISSTFLSSFLCNCALRVALFGLAASCLALILAASPQPWTSGMWCDKQYVLSQHLHLCPSVLILCLHASKAHWESNLVNEANMSSKSSSGSFVEGGFVFVLVFCGFGGWSDRPFFFAVCFVSLSGFWSQQLLTAQRVKLKVAAWYSLLAQRTGVH